MRELKEGIQNNSMNPKRTQLKDMRKHRNDQMNSKQTSTNFEVKPKILLKR
jgi:hypothetical protein